MKKYELQAGLVVGLITVILFFILHQINPKWMLSPVLYWGSLLFYLLGMLGACLLAKRAGSGVLSFRDALRTGFLTFLVANLIFFAFYYFMFAIYNPDLPLFQKELYAEYYEQNFTSNDLRKRLKELGESDFSVTIRSSLSGFANGAIGGFILSLLLALVVRQEA